MALDVHAEDLAGLLGRVVRAAGELDATRLAAAADLDLRLDDHHTRLTAEELLRAGAGLLRGGGDDAAEHGNAVLLEDVTCLVLEQVHLVWVLSSPAFDGLCAAETPRMMVAAGWRSLHIERCGVHNAVSATGCAQPLPGTATIRYVPGMDPLTIVAAPLGTDVDGRDR